MKWTEKKAKPELIKLSSCEPEKFYKAESDILYYAMAPRSGSRVFGLCYAGPTPSLLSSSECDGVYVYPDPVHGTLEF